MDITQIKYQRVHNNQHTLYLKKCANHGKLQFRKAQTKFDTFSIHVQHQHTFRNDVPNENSLSLHFCLFYLLLNSSNGNDAKSKTFSVADCLQL